MNNTTAQNNTAVHTVPAKTAITKYLDHDENFRHITKSIPADQVSYRQNYISSKVGGGKWTDPQFSPNETALMGRSRHHSNTALFNDVASNYLPDIEWKRASEIHGANPKLFDGILSNDIKLGAFQNKSLASAISCLGEKEGLVKRIFNTHSYNPAGVYGINLNIAGAWKEIVVDDYLPVSKKTGQMYGMHSTAGQKELWVSLLEKAYAKAYGSYLNIAGASNPLDCLFDLTGVRPSAFPHDKTPQNDLFQIIKNNFGKYLITATRLAHVPDAQDQDIISAILFCGNIKTSDGSTVRLVKIRNDEPNRKNFGNLDWANKANAWDASEYQTHCVDGATDCSWLEFNDFVSMYSSTAIFRISPTEFYNTVKANHPIASDHQASISDNNVDPEKSIFLVKVQEPGVYSFGINQKDTRLVSSEYPNYHISSSRMNVIDLASETYSMDAQNDPKHLVTNKHYSVQTARNNGSFVNIQAPGVYAVLAEVYWNNNVHREFTLSVNGPSLAQIENLTVEQINNTVQANTQNMKKLENYYYSLEYQSWKNFAIQKLREMKTTGNPNILQEIPFSGQDIPQGAVAAYKVIGENQKMLEEFKIDLIIYENRSDQRITIVPDTPNVSPSTATVISELTVNGPPLFKCFQLNEFGVEVLILKGYLNEPIPNFGQGTTHKAFGYSDEYTFTDQVVADLNNYQFKNLTTLK